MPLPVPETMDARSPGKAMGGGGAQMLIERREWQIASEVSAITPMVETVQALCVTAGFSPRQCRFNIPIAITEALSNAILRGNENVSSRLVRIAIALEPQRLVVEITDEGNGFDLAGLQQSPDDPDWFEREDGRGMFLMRSLMDVVETCVPDERRGHTLRLILHRP
jgi:serine/threonine-protein kinase RsbW